MFKAIRSNTVYVPLIIILGAMGLFSLYYFFYVSWQRSYATDRAFRLLTVVGDQLATRHANLRNIFAASLVSSDPEDYLKEVLKDDISNIHTTCSTCTKRDGELTLRLIETPTRSFSLEAMFHPVRGNKASSCFISGDVDLNTDLCRRFRNVTEEYFDDILIATSAGEVLFQKNTSGLRITDLNALLPPKAADGKTPKADEPEPNKPGLTRVKPATAFRDASQFSNVIGVRLAGADYKLYLQPVRLNIADKDGQNLKPIVCGLWRSDRLQSEVVSIPHSVLIWGTLLVLAIFALGWPLLKVAYMSPSERLRRRHVFYLLCSALFATTMLTLMVLNFSYIFREDEESKEQLVALADRIESNVKGELKRTVDFLDALGNDDYLHQEFRKTTDNNWTGKNVLGSSFFGKHPAGSYPYFDNIFWVDKNGEQQFKLTVKPRATPRTPVATEAWFRDVRDGLHLSALPDDPRRYRFDSVYSQNTGEFFVVLARPYATPKDWKDVPPKYFRDLTAEVVVTKFLSLVDPVMPPGFGYAVVDHDGLVHFHSSAARNKVENFFKECNQDPALRAAVLQGAGGSMDVNYLGKQQEMLVRPMPYLGEPASSLIVFRDGNHFTTVNVACMLVFALLAGLFSLPFGVALAIYVFRRGDYPLSGLWPGAAEVPKYVNLVVASACMTAAYAMQFQSMKMDANLVAVLTMTAAVLVFGSLKQNWTTVRTALLGKAPVLVAILVISACAATVARRWVVASLAAGLYIALSIPAVAQVLEQLATRFVKVKHMYLAAALSLLIVLVVAPCFGIFKIAYDTVNRLALESAQLARRDQLVQRAEQARRYFVDLKAEGYAEQRIQELLDRYDEAVFYPTYHRNLDRQDRDISILEKPIALASAWFPSNRLGAELRERATAADARLGLQWKSARDNDDEVLWLDGAPSAGELVGVYPIWQLPWPAGVLMALLAVVLAFWLNSIIRKVFMADMQDVPQLENWVLSESGSRNLLIIGHPKSGKSASAASVPEADVLDLTRVLTTGDWAVQALGHPVVVVDHFEFDMDNADTSFTKLKLLEQLLYVERKRVILVSAVDPMFYLATSSPEIITPNNGSHESPGQILDRWAAVLSMFEKAKFEDVKEGYFKRVLTGQGDPGQEQMAEIIKNECNHTAQLRKIGLDMLKAHRHQEPVSKAELVEELLDRADSYYRVLGSTCTKDERLVLFQLARDGWANPKNERAIQQLQRRRLIHRGSGYRIMNDSFCQFIRTAHCPEEAAQWEADEQHSTWSAVKLGLSTALLMFGAWLLFTQQDVFQMGIGYVAALGTASGAILNLTRSLRGKGGAADAG
jgi:hypothetical protein